ncbi:hypothetical protein EIN_354210 [Entamoeba invadens IP1]|uniref:CCHC-type domain-containing protein n=1 Tax=Entamoeba invadens IP1 TaxID=370355 RepID=L7FLN1_ENTIV|nr:hypothetical protein EIN_354210 [Entamoeba invadens IP1]ELP87149.1 hypothetical protein EIN_354210 [Entamoeba invadens IP1]|eukprot:XP_004253920.1 hypothetical protein EIN_354210 [Entamoeba invadens IP1]
MSKGIKTTIVGIHPSLTDDEIHEFLKPYQPISVDIPRYAEDTNLSYCDVLFDNEEAVMDLIAKKDKKIWRKKTVNVRKDLKNLKNVHFSYPGLKVTEDEVKKYLSEFNPIKVTQMTKKKGEMKSNNISVVMKDIEMIDKLKFEWEGKELKGEKLHIVGKNKNGSAIKQCKICNKLGHTANNCNDKFKNVECFICKGYGHKQWDCPQKKCLSDLQKAEEDDDGQETKYYAGQIRNNKENY